LTKTRVLRRDRGKLRLAWIGVVGAAAALAVGLGVSSASNAASKASPIRLGVLTSLTGSFAPWGIQTRAGMALAVNELNRSGGVKGKGQGRLLNLDVQDDQSTPTAGIDGFRKLTEQDHVVSIGGIIGSNVALATARLTEQAQVPMFLVKAGANEILTKDSRYTFRTCLPAADEVAVPIAQLAQKRGLKSVGAIIADYAWGQSIKKSLTAAFGAVNIGINVQVAPLTATDFTPYLRALGNVPLIVATGDPPGSGAILAQSGQLGVKVPVVGAYSPFSLTAKAAGSASYGRWADFKCMNTASKGYQTLAKRFLKTFPQNQFFEDDALAGYAYVKMVAEAISSVGDDPKAIASYIHSHTFNIPGYAFPLKWTAWGEIVGPTPVLEVLTKGPPPDPALNAGGSWWPKVLSKSQPLTPYQPS
jgi:branched-chain amino acid transport system substrate-binding protein